MKKISFVFSAVFYIILQSGAQNTIVKTNSTWSVLEYGTILAGGSGEMPQQTICCIGTEEITIRNDSTYNEREYKKVFSNIGIKNKFRGLIREEDQKIFFIRQNLLHEHLLYDFSIENGEMIAITDTGGTEISLYAVVDEIIVNEVIKKRIQLKWSLEDESAVNTWIEGIGSMCGLLYNGLPKTGGGMKLLCVSQNGTPIYQNPLFAKCSYDDSDRQEIGSILGLPVHTGLNAINDSDFSIQVSDGEAAIHSFGRMITQIEIFNISGQKVYFKRKLKNPNEIQLRFLNKGLHIIKLYDADNRSHHLKFIRK